MINLVNRNTFITLYERHAGWLPAAVTGVFAVLLGVQIAQTAWQVVPEPANTWRPLPERSTVTRGGTPSGPNVNAIIGAELFGRYVPPAVQEQRIEDAPDTRLSLRLLGVYATQDESLSRAIISQAGGDEKPYAVGNDISRGVRLQAIYSDRVILSREGVLETLRMERDAPSMASTSAPAARGTDNVAPDPAQLGEIRNQLLEDPAQAQNFIRVVPANVGGAQRGYRIYPGRDRSLFTAAGLRPGDLVTAVNGIDLDDPAKALQLLTELSDATSINVTVERGGNIQNYSLSTQ
jgi:general secretion pathway protein C